MTFPNDFILKGHRIVKEAVQWLPKVETDTFISIVGGFDCGLYGNGNTSFELMIDNRVYGWQSIEEVNQLIKDL